MTEKTIAILALRCPEANGGCGRQSGWFVAIDETGRRVIADCVSCHYRMSFPLDISKLTDALTGPLDKTGILINP